MKIINYKEPKHT